MLSLFPEQERELIEKLDDDNIETWEKWYAYYQSLSTKEQSLAKYMLSAAGKDWIAEWYAGLDLCPFAQIAQKDVNNGYGQIFAIDRESFFSSDPKLFYLRSDMWINPDKDTGEVPEWIQDVIDDIEKNSSGLTDIKAERIQYSFNGEAPENYYVITFRLERKNIRKAITICDMTWYPPQYGGYFFSLMDITGGYICHMGELSVSPVVLYHVTMDWKG